MANKRYFIVYVGDDAYDIYLHPKPNGPYYVVRRISSDGDESWLASIIRERYDEFLNVAEEIKGMPPTV